MDAILSYEKLEEDDYYFILGCDELSSVEQIYAEYKARALLCHPDKHPGDTSAGEKFSKLQRAKEVLCCEESRKHYDKWRRSGISMSYENWCAKKDSVHTSMHWAGLSKKKPMLEEGPPTKEELKWQLHDKTESKCSADLAAMGWIREDSDILRKFRNYEF